MTLMRYLMIEGNFSETITSEASLAPYNTNDLNAMMALIGPLNGKDTGDSRLRKLIVELQKVQGKRTSIPCVSLVCCITLALLHLSHGSSSARLMQTFSMISGRCAFLLGVIIIPTACTQFINFCGQPAARLDVDKPLYYQRDEILGWKAFLLRLLNIALFGSLQSHRNSIERVWVDNSVVVTRWKNFIDGLNTEWGSFTVFVSETFLYPRVYSYPSTVNSNACCRC